MNKKQKAIAWVGAVLAVAGLLFALGVIDADTFNAIKAVFGQ